MPEPVTTPSPGTLLRLHAEVDAIMLDDTCHILRSCRDRAGRDSRSRAVSRPLACCAAIRFSPPPSLASFAALFEFFDRRGHDSAASSTLLGRVNLQSFHARPALGQSARAGVYVAAAQEPIRNLSASRLRNRNRPTARWIYRVLTTGGNIREMLKRVGVPVEFVAEPSAPDPERPTLLCFSHLRWDFVFQRPQHLMSRFAQRHDGRLLGRADRRRPGRNRLPPGPRRPKASPNVRIVAPHLPEGMSEDQREAALKRLLDDSRRRPQPPADRLVLHADDAALLAASRRQRGRL